MATIDAAPEWAGLIKTIWARRLVPVAQREGGRSGLFDAWESAIAEAWRQSWELDGVVPLRTDPHGHKWAVVVSRLEPTADMVLIHGDTPVDALERTTRELYSLP